MEGLTPTQFPLPDYAEEATRMKVIETLSKMHKYFGSHEKILISVSGGSDSDCIVHLVCKYFQEHLQKCLFVFANTGLEFKATKEHLVYLEKKYGITINRIRGVSVVTSCKQNGVPILSKKKSHSISLYLRGKPSGWRKVFGDISTYNSFNFTQNQKEMVKYIEAAGIKISDLCCDISKKKPLKKFLKENGCDMQVTGERKSEGGQRAAVHNTCFEECNRGVDKYMPLWWWTNEEKADFKAAERIVYSDCYEVYGMKRTGCCGCPCALNIADELRIMAEHEPQLLKACMHVFGQAYELTDRFNCRRKKCLPECLQLTITGEIERGVIQ